MELRVQFYNPEQDRDGLLNKLVAYADPPYCHCELEFANNLSCAVYMGGLVHIKTRNFDPASYDSIAVRCTPQQHAAALELVQRLVADHQAFSTRAMLASRFRAVPAPDQRFHTCCSKLCADVLRAADALPPESVTGPLTPSRLYHAMATPTVVCDSTVIDFAPRAPDL